jgi:hypothetical protein
MEVHDIKEIEILETLQRIRQANEQIAFHLNFAERDEFAVRQLKEFRSKLFHQLEELFAEMEVPMRAIAA